VMPPVWAVGDLSKGSPRHQSRDGNPKRLTMHGFCLCFRLNRRKMRRSLYLFASGCQRASPGIKTLRAKFISAFRKILIVSESKSNRFARLSLADISAGVFAS